MEQKPPVINSYFQESKNSDIFDQISDLNINESNADSTKESVGVNTTGCTLIKEPPKNEPVVCKIFASQEEHNSPVKNAPNSNFFDMLGSASSNVTQLPISPITDGLKVKPLGYGGIFSPEFPSEGSFFSPSSGTDVDSDAVNEEFAKGTSGSASEADRRRDAWIPSARTRRALIASATAPSGSYVPDRDLLTMPGVVLQEDMVDNIYEAVNHYLGEAEAAKRKVLTVNDVTQDERGLRELIQAECYRGAINLTSRLLNIYGQGVGRAGSPSKHTLHSIQLWFTRIALLAKLKSWSIAWAEAEPWWDLDRPDLYFQFYSELYGGRPGTIVPFSFRLLLAELPQFVRKPQEAFSRLFSVLDGVRKILENLRNDLSEDGSHLEISNDDREESKKLWSSRETRVLHSIINLALNQQEYTLAVELMNDLIENPKKTHSIHYHRSLLSAMGRIFLKLGDTECAKSWFMKSADLKTNIHVPDFQELVDSGLMALADNKFEKGYEFFRRASERDPTNIMVRNNMAVCLLYCSKQKEAVDLLESAIHENPVHGLNESLLLNLCTLYELESTSAVENKHCMLKMVSKYKGDSVSLHCLKLQMND